METALLARSPLAHRPVAASTFGDAGTELALASLRRSSDGAGSPADGVGPAIAAPLESSKTSAVRRVAGSYRGDRLHDALCDVRGLAFRGSGVRSESAGMELA